MVGIDNHRLDARAKVHLLRFDTIGLRASSARVLLHNGASLELNLGCRALWRGQSRVHLLSRNEGGLTRSHLLHCGV